jgi:hypothetical protein
MGKLAPKDLAEILAPTCSDEFLRSTFGQSFQLIPGPAGKFSDLLPWESLNQILRQHRLESPRLRMFLEGKQVPVDSYQSFIRSERRRNVQTPRLRGRDLLGKLREGATLILDAVDELYEPLTALVESLEVTFAEKIQVNAYAGWFTSPGFDLHWDDHDVFILQLFGRKKWMVYGATRPYPLARDVERNNQRPTAPIWEGELSDGDLLYIPRGWWHAAVPLAEPTLHLTIGVHNRTGIDLLGWLQEQLRGSEMFRMDLPRFASAESRAAHMQKLKQELLSRWNDDLLEDYFHERDAMASPRNHFGLPWSVLPDALPAGEEFAVRLATPRKLVIVDDPDGAAFSFKSLGREWRFAAPARPIVDLLSARGPLSLRELSDRTATSLDRAAVRNFVAELVKEGLIVLVG